MFILKLITETEIFHDILEEFTCLEEDFNENEIWKSNAIIKLMQGSNKIPDKQIIEEGLKIVLSLCRFRECGYLVDSYESESYLINNLIEPDKSMIYSILKTEFT